MNKKRKYYALYDDNGFGAYSIKGKMENDLLYTVSGIVVECDDPDTAKWMAEEGFNSLGHDITGDEVIGEYEMRLNWFYRVPKDGTAV